MAAMESEDTLIASQRPPKFGIRIAVGASAANIVRMRWTNPDRSVFWKLPASDVPYLPQLPR